MDRLCGSGDIRRCRFISDTPSRLPNYRDNAGSFLQHARENADKGDMDRKMRKHQLHVGGVATVSTENKNTSKDGGRETNNEQSSNRKDRK